MLISSLVALALVLGLLGRAVFAADRPAHRALTADPAPSASPVDRATTSRAGASSTSSRAASSAPPQSSGTPTHTATPAATRLKVPRSGPRTYTGADVSAAARGSKGRLIRYDVRVEKGVPVRADDAARFVAATLDDKRSWVGRGRWRFELVSSPARAELHAYIATPGTTDRLCAPLRTYGKVSCENGTKVVLNAERWVHGAASYGDDLTGYRHSLVNHEFGHYLGFGHVACPGKGKPAPVMMQQTKGLDGCRRNPWPDPHR